MPEYCLVKHRISTYVIDGDDADRNPDRIPVTGGVTFIPLLNKGDSVVATENGIPTTITLTPIEALITNGEIYHRGEEGVKLFAGGPDTNPDRIRYRAKFSNLIAGGKRIDLKDILFEAVPGGELTLSMAQPVPGTPYPGYSATIEQGITEISDATVSYLDQIEGARDDSLVQIEGARDESLGQVTTAVSAEVDAIKWTRGRTPSGATLDTLADGVWWVQSGWSDLKLPNDSYGTLIKTLSPTPTHGNALFISNVSNRGVWTISRNSTGWQSWTRVDIGGMTTPNAAYVPTSSTLDDLTAGTWWVSYGRAAGLGLPEALYGSLTISIAGPLPTHRTALFISSTASQEVWTIARNSTGWQSWTRVDLGGMPDPDAGDPTSPVHQAPISADYFPDATAPLEADTSRVVMWGDSLTQMGGIRTRLMALQPGVDVVNRGLSWQTAPQIAARQGGRMATIEVAGGSIPASGSVTVSKISERVLYSGPSYPALTLTGTILGVHGTLSNAAGTENYTFTRTNPGLVVPVSAGAFFFPDHALDSRHSAQILWAGRNSPDKDPVESVRAMLKWLTPARKRVVVLSITGASTWVKGTADYETVERANTQLKRIAGTAYIDLRRWLIDHGLEAVGITPTAEDHTAIAGDAIPRSLTSDGTHFTSDAQTAIGTYLHGELLARGWWD